MCGAGSMGTVNPFLGSADTLRTLAMIIIQFLCRQLLTQKPPAGIWTWCSLSSLPPFFTCAALSHLALNRSLSSRCSATENHNVGLQIVHKNNLKIQTAGNYTGDLRVKCNLLLRRDLKSRHWYWK